MISFTVIGDPGTKGSTRSFRNKHTGKIMTTNNCTKEKPWAQQVQWDGRQAMGDAGPLEGPMSVELDFFLKRPQRLKNRLSVPCDKRPDGDKLARSAIDALTGVCWLDDSQLTQITIRKWYADPGEPTGARIRVTVAS